MYVPSATLEGPSAHATYCLHSVSDGPQPERFQALRGCPQAFRIPEAALLQCMRVAGVLGVKIRPADSPFLHRRFTAESFLPSFVTRPTAIPYCIPAASAHRAGRSALRNRTVPQHPLDLRVTAIVRDFGCAHAPDHVPFLVSSARRSGVATSSPLGGPVCQPARKGDPRGGSIPRRTTSGEKCGDVCAADVHSDPATGPWLSRTVPHREYGASCAEDHPPSGSR